VRNGGGPLAYMAHSVIIYVTARDISHYVHSKFNAHRGFMELQKGNPKVAARLCDHVTKKASGVFLWVHLAVQSLLRGISNGDRIDDLERAVNGLPEDLEMLFSKILDSVNPRYREHSAQLFRIHREASLHWGGFRLLRFSYADDDDQAMWEEQSIPLEKEEYIFRMRSMNRRLDSRTKGLLETTSSMIDELDEK
jgi:hypothetical protein